MTALTPVAKVAGTDGSVEYKTVHAGATGLLSAAMSPAESMTTRAAPSLNSWTMVLPLPMV